MRRAALLGALLAWACSGRRERVVESGALNDLARLHVLADGTLLAFGALEPDPASLYSRRARILRVAPGARDAAVVHDGEGSVIDASAPTASAIFALVRTVKPGGVDVVREFWALASTDGGLSWQKRSLPKQDSLEYLEFADADHGWLLGYHGAFATADGGGSWVPIVGPPKPMLQKNLLRSGDGGAIVFQKGAIEARDPALALIRGLSLGALAEIDCLARVDGGRLLAVGRIGPGKAQRAFAQEVTWPDLLPGRELAGLPEDFLCDRAVSAAGGVVLTGARTGTGSVFGLSHVAMGLAPGASRLREVGLSQRLVPAVFAIGETPRPFVGQVRHGAESWMLVIDRERSSFGASP
jgi:hypothetical protein